MEEKVVAHLNQVNLFEQSICSKIQVRRGHPLVELTKIIDWDRMMELAINIRMSKVKSLSGPEPHYRELLGAVVLMAIKNVTYRDAEDLIAHYAPARYLCDLMDSGWQPDHITVFEFTQMLGKEGMEAINTEALNLAREHDLLDTEILMSDTTAQEAKIPYPTEVGLMTKFIQTVDKNLKTAGEKFSHMKGKIKEVVKKVKGLARSYHLFAKGKEAKNKVSRKIFYSVKQVQEELTEIFASYNPRSTAMNELGRLSEVMQELLPQIKHFLDTGFVAQGKILHLKMEELYSIVRGKAGKSVEFGIKWGINRIGSGFVQGFLIGEGEHASDKKFCIEAIRVHKENFKIAPKIYGFDRGGYSKSNIKKAQKMGVEHVGIAPVGKAAWAISESKQKQVKRERAQVEGVIGTIKNSRYGFNKPNAKSLEAMVRCGHKAILGFNLQKILRENQKLILSSI
jgi:hypothetical protein